MAEDEITVESTERKMMLATIKDSAGLGGKLKACVTCKLLPTCGAGQRTMVRMCLDPGVHTGLMPGWDCLAHEYVGWAEELEKEVQAEAAIKEMGRTQAVGPTGPYQSGLSLGTANPNAKLTLQGCNEHLYAEYPDGTTTLLDTHPGNVFDCNTSDASKPQ